MQTFLHQHILLPLQDFIFTPICFHCDERLEDYDDRICKRCWSSLRKVHTSDHTYLIMKERFASSGIINGFYPLFYFEKGEVFQTLVHSLKYNEIRNFGFRLGVELGKYFKEISITADAIIPIPLNSAKYRERGYNQSEYIAKGISSITNIPTRTNLVERIKYTTTQTHLNADQRKENVSDAFQIAVPKSIEGKTFLLIDDVITTGATIQEVGRILKNGGAVAVYVASAGLAKLGEDA